MVTIMSSTVPQIYREHTHISICVGNIYKYIYGVGNIIRKPNCSLCCMVLIAHVTGYRRNKKKTIFRL